MTDLPFNLTWEGPGAEKPGSAKLGGTTKGPATPLLAAGRFPDWSVRLLRSQLAVQIEGRSQLVPAYRKRETPQGAVLEFAFEGGTARLVLSPGRCLGAPPELKGGVATLRLPSGRRLSGCAAAAGAAFRR